MSFRSSWNPGMAGVEGTGGMQLEREKVAEILAY